MQLFMNLFINNSKNQYKGIQMGHPMTFQKNRMSHKLLTTVVLLP